MIEIIEIARVDEKGTVFSVPRLLVALDIVGRAAGALPIQPPFDDEGRMSPSTMAGFASSLRILMATAMKNEGSLTVRFLGDLKPTVYPIDTQFFQLNESATDETNFNKILQEALLKGDKQELTLINLRNIRDVKIHIGNHRVSGTTDDLRYLDTFCGTLEAWADEDVSIRVRNSARPGIG